MRHLVAMAAAVVDGQAISLIRYKCMHALSIGHT